MANRPLRSCNSYQGVSKRNSVTVTLWNSDRITNECLSSHEVSVWDPAQVEIHRQRKPSDGRKPPSLIKAEYFHDRTSDHFGQF
jgi:hypothetical protein